MEDLLFPNNPKREARVYELGDDIGTLVNDLVKDADEIKRLLDLLDTKINQMYSDIEVDIPSSETKQFEYQGWVVNVVQGLEALVFFKPVEAALKNAAVFSLRRAGRIGEAAFYDSLSIGLESLDWIKFGVEAGAVAVVVVIDIAIAGIAGEVKKEKLRKCIHSAIEPRIQLKKAALINGMLRQKLQTVVDTVDTLKELGYTKDQLDQAQETISEKFKEEVSEVTDEKAKEELAKLDHHRGSWTNEDHHH